MRVRIEMLGMVARRRDANRRLGVQGGYVKTLYKQIEASTTIHLGTYLP